MVNCKFISSRVRSGNKSDIWSYNIWWFDLMMFCQERWDCKLYANDYIGELLNEMNENMKDIRRKVHRVVNGFSSWAKSSYFTPTNPGRQGRYQNLSKKSFGSKLMLTIKLGKGDEFNTCGDMLPSNFIEIFRYIYTIKLSLTLNIIQYRLKLVFLRSGTCF